MFASLKETLQALLAISVLATVFWGAKQHSLAVLRASNEVQPAAGSPDDFRASRQASSQVAKRHGSPRHPGIHSRFLDLPICADLSEALQQMQAAAVRLGDGSDLYDGRRSTTAQDEYQAAVSRVRAELQILHALVAPEQYEGLCTHVIERTLPDNLSRLAARRLVNSGAGMAL